MAVTTIPGSWFNEYRGLSTDPKPTNRVPNGSTFYEFDTVKLFVFDSTNQVWHEQK